MEKQVKVLWSKTAYKALEKHCNHIQKESLQSAIKVKSGIIAIAKSLANTPTRYPLDKYRIHNKGDIRAFEKYSLRIAYQVCEKEIRILRVRHTKRNPLLY